MSIYDKTTSRLNLHPDTDNLISEVTSTVIHDGLASVLSDDRKTKIDQINQNWDFYNGNQIGYVNRYHGEDADEFAAKTKIPLNYTRLVVDQYIKGVFGTVAKIDFDNHGSQDIWDSIVSAYNFDWLQFTKKLQRIEELSYMALAVLRYDEANNRVFYNTYRGDNVLFFPSKYDPTGYEAVLLDYTYDMGLISSNSGIDSSVVRRIELYTHHDIRVIDVYGDNDIHYVFEEPNLYVDTLNKNKNTILPVVRFVAEEDDFSLYGNNSIHDIVKLNHAYNLLWIDFMQVLKFQAFSILFARHTDFNRMKIAPTRLFTTDDPNADLKYVVPDASINEFRSAIELYKSEMLDLSSLPVEALSGTNKSTVETGYSLRIKRMPIEQLWERRQDSNRNSLVELSRKTMLFSQIHQNSSGVYDDKAITIDFGEVDAPLVTSEQQIKDEWEVRNGIVSPYELLMTRNPDITKEQAKEKYEENILDIAEVVALRGKEGLETELYASKKLNQIQGDSFSSTTNVE